jgi:outer membrane protein assembly factor BamB
MKEDRSASGTFLRRLRAMLAATGLLVGALILASPPVDANAAAAPTITSFSPTSGSVGTSVTIGGSGFTGASKVTFGGLTAPFTVDSGTQISATVPPAARSGKIAVTVPGQPRATSSTAFAVILGPSWAQFGYGAQRTGFNPVEKTLSPSNVSGLSKTWGIGFGLDAGGGEPAVSDGAVYASEGDSSEILAASAATGSTLWTFSNGLGGEFSDPAVVGGVVYTGGGSVTTSTGNDFYALNAGTGKTKWKFTDFGSFGQDAAVVGGSVYVISNGPPSTAGNFSILYALNAGTGHVEWSFQPFSSVGSGTTDSMSAPTVSNGVVYVGVTLAPSMAPDVFSMYALNATTGLPVWTNSSVDGTVSSAAVVGSVAYVASSDTVYALNTSDGSVKWHKAPSDGSFPRLEFEPAVASGMVVVRDGTNGWVIALRASNGTTVWTDTTTGPTENGGCLPNATIANGIVYVGSSGIDNNAGLVTAMTLSTGVVLWTYDGGLADFSPVAILNGSLYVSANSGANALAAFSLPPAP